MKIRTLAKQIEKMQEVAGCDATYGIIDGVVYYIYYIHFKDEKIPAMPLIIQQNKFNTRHKKIFLYKRRGEKSMEEKIQELIEKIYNYDILRVQVLFKDFGKYIIEGTFLLREEVSFNFLYSYNSSMSIEYNIQQIENIIDDFIIKLCKYKED